MCSIMSDFKLEHPNFEWEGRQTCVMNSEELLNILRKVSEKRDYHRSRAHTLYRCTIDIRRILPVGYEGDTTFYVCMLYNLEHAMAFHRYYEGQWLTKLALVDAQLLYKDGPIGLPPYPTAE